MKRGILWLLVLVITVSLIATFSLASCKKETVPSDGVVSQEGVTTKAEVTKVKPHLIFWIDNGVKMNWFEDVVKDINANEDFEVEISYKPTADYIELLTAAAVGQSGFDIDLEWSGSTSTLMRGLGGAYTPVNNLIQESTLSKLNQGTLASNTDGKGNIWGVPVYTDINYMIYNKKILKDAGIDISKMPLTWEDFVNVCQKVKSNGIIPITFANKETIMNEFWGIDMMYQYFDTPKDVKEYFLKGEFNNNVFRDLMTKYKYLFDEGYFDPAGQTLDFATNYFQKFASGKTACIWTVGSLYNEIIKGGGIAEGDIGIQKHVQFGDGKLNNFVPGLGFCVDIAKWTKYPKECAKVIEYLVSDKWQAELLTKYSIIPSNIDIKVNNMESLPDHVKFFFENGKNEFTVTPYEFLIGDQYEIWSREASLYLSGSITFEEFAKELGAASIVK